MDLFATQDLKHVRDKQSGDPVCALSVPRSGRTLDVGQLVGASEMAKRAGVRRAQVVHVWRQRYLDFPGPVALESP